MISRLSHTLHSAALAILSATILTSCQEQPSTPEPTPEIQPKPAAKITSIDEAIARGNTEAVEQILAATPEAANTGTRPNSPPLHQALLRKKPEIAQLLIDAGADSNATDATKRTPLHLCVERDLPDLIAPLIAAGAKPSQRDDAGWTPLHLAGAKNRLTAAQQLLAHGANIDARSNLGGTPLHEAAASGSPEIIQLYLDAGVDTSVVAEGGTALDIAKEFENEAGVKLLSE